MIEEKHYSHAELAFYWNVSEQSVWRAFRHRKGVVPIGNAIRIPKSVVEAYMVEQEIERQKKKLNPVPGLSAPFKKAKCSVRPGALASAPTRQLACAGSGCGGSCKGCKKGGKHSIPIL